ncbi:MULTISPECIES: HtaA domain-containing protein [Bacteria]|uniref:HtaA domain-containing protein n=1 Tax=Bacteria TaxID=2 RepID=UPI003C7A168B
MLRRPRLRGVLPVMLASALVVPVLAAVAPSATATAAPVAGRAAPVPVAAPAGGCTVTGGTLTWGFKESFRSYISGTIANGSWEASDGASYSTPTFSWSGATGEVDAQGNGRIRFAGTVRFTGHGGLLDTRISSPVLVLGPSGAVLQLDTSGVSMDDALAGKTDAVAAHPAVPFAALSLDPAAVFAGRSGEVSASDVPATVTPEGFAAFGSYEAGTALDPVSVAVTLDCVSSSPSPEPAATSAGSSPAAETPGPDAGPGVSGADAGPPPWLGWSIAAAVVLLVAGVTAGTLRARRRRSRTTPVGQEASDAAAVDTVPAEDATADPQTGGDLGGRVDGEQGDDGPRR